MHFQRGELLLLWNIKWALDSLKQPMLHQIMTVFGASQNDPLR